MSAASQRSGHAKTAKDHLRHDEEWQVAICKECMHAIWPSDVQGHFRGPKHRMPLARATSIQQEVGVWSRLIHVPSMFKIPVQVIEPIEGLPIVHDGLKCTAEPSACQFICRSEKWMRQHAKDEHAYVQHCRRNRPSRATQRRVQEVRPVPWKQVSCQIFFKSKEGRKFFEVSVPLERAEDQDRGEMAWQQMMDNAQRDVEAADNAASARVEQSKTTDANPWLKRARWSEYLVDLNKEDLLQCIDQPDMCQEKIEVQGIEKSHLERRRAKRKVERKVRQQARRVKEQRRRRTGRHLITAGPADLDEEEKEEEDEGDREEEERGREREEEGDEDEREDEEKDDQDSFDMAIWEAMGSMMAFCQETATGRLGTMVRMELVRKEMHQTVYEPLQRYMDTGNMHRHTRPWKQMMMFFARTQRRHRWKSPKYEFSDQEGRAWERVVDAVQTTVLEEVAHPDGDRGEEVHGTDEGSMEADSNIQNTPSAASAAEACKEELSDLEGALLDFCLELLQRKVESDEYELPAVCALAVLGVQEGGWRGVDSYPPILSALIKMSRCFVGQKAWDQTRQNVIEAGAVMDMQKVEGTVTRITKMMDRFMVRGSHGAMEWMMDLRTYGRKIWQNNTSAGKVDWKDGDTIVYPGMTFSMSDLRGFVHSLIAKSRELLEEELLFVSKRHPGQLPEVPWRSLVDSMTDATPGWNFIQDARNPWPVDGERWVRDRIRTSERLRLEFHEGVAGSRGMKRERIERYIQGVVDFRGKLMVMMHLTAGQPARGTELVTLRHTNTASGGDRGVFVEDGMVVMVTRYTKEFSKTSKMKIIHRYLPREVGDLFVKYLWLVLPFERTLEAMIYGNADRTGSGHVWPEDPFTGKAWGSARLTKELEKATVDGLGHRIGVAKWRDLAIAISRKFLRDKEQFKNSGEEEAEVENEADVQTRTADEQAGHGSHVAEVVYARFIDELTGAVASKRHRFRLSSLAWHKLLALQGPAGFEGAGWDGKEKVKEEVDALQARWRRIRSMNADEELRKVMGEGAQFRGVQKDAIKAITNGSTPVVAVMPTGGGKSLLFMLPAMCGVGGMTIVVVPLVALRSDMIRRCRELGVVSSEWTAVRQPDGARVVFVTPESAISPTFKLFINRAKRSQRLDRIVIDECHTALQGSRTFRPHLAKLGELTGAEVQMVLLTATLPPEEEATLWKRMEFEAREVKMFRARTTRKNIAYNVVQCKGGEEDEEQQAEATVEKLRREMVGRGKMVVYCKYAKQVRKLAERLDCDAYHSKAQEKAKKMEEFAKGEKDLIVATNAMGLGIDIANIRAVVHVGMSRNVMDFAQESGRAGRDGKASQSIVIVAEAWEKRMEAYDWKDEPEPARALVRRFVDGRAGECRRKVLDEYLDGVHDRRSCEAEEERCDQCRAAGGGIGTGRTVEEQEVVQRKEDVKVLADVYWQQKQIMAASRDRWMNEKAEEARQWKEFEEDMRWWNKRCGVCQAKGANAEHPLSACREVMGQAARRDAVNLRQRIQYDDYAACFQCGAPQGICETWEEKVEGDGRYVRSRKPCQFQGVIIDGLMGMRYGYGELVEGPYRKRMSEAGMQERGLAAEAKVLGKMSRWFAYDCSISAMAFGEAARWVRMAEEHDEAADEGGRGEAKTEGDIVMEQDVEEREAWEEDVARVGERQAQKAWEDSRQEESKREERRQEERRKEEKEQREQRREQRRQEKRQEQRKQEETRGEDEQKKNERQEEEHDRRIKWEEEQREQRAEAAPSSKEPEEETMRKIKVGMERWNGQCMVCWVHETEAMHGLKECGMIDDLLKAMMQDSRERFMPRIEGSCAGCGLPQGLCRAWQEGATTWKGCQAPHVMVDVVMAMMWKWPESKIMEGMQSVQEKRAWRDYMRGGAGGDAALSKLMGFLGGRKSGSSMNRLSVRFAALAGDERGRKRGLEEVKRQEKENKRQKSKQEGRNEHVK